MAVMKISAKFDSLCAMCGKKISKHSEVYWDRANKRVYCPACAAKGKFEVGASGIKKKPSEETITVQKKPETTADVEIDREKVKEIVDKMVEEMATTTVGNKKDEVKSAISDEIESAKQRVKDELLKEFGEIPKTIIVIQEEGKKPKKIKEITHKKFADIVTMVTAKVPVFLRGDAGCGKNHMVKQIASALDLEFYFSNAITNEYKITGFIDANGKYHETQFYEAFTKGGLFFFDEIDASIPEVLVLLNAAIENGYFNFPTGKKDAHKDFRIIAAGNTFGSGATAQYVGRYQLDAASLDRFAVVDITYDEQVENVIAGGDKELVQAIHVLRSVTSDAGIKIVLSYRAINQITKLHTEKKLPIVDVMKYTVLKGMGVDDMNIIKPKIKNRGNKYLDALVQAMN